MIQVTAYLRDDEDLDKWKAVPNKVQFLHQALQHVQSREAMNRDYDKKIEKVIVKKAKSEYCKNGHPLDSRGRCFGKGCKYA